MTITVTVPAFSDAPQRQDPDDFDNRGDTFLGELEVFPVVLNTYKDELNATQIEINTSESNAADSATLSGTRAGYSQSWAINAEDVAITVPAGGDGATTFSSLHHSAKANKQRTYSKEWSQAAINTPISANAGGNGTTDRSSLHWSDVAKQWALSAEDVAIPILAGGDGVTTFSALHHALKAKAYMTTAQLAAAVAGSIEGLPALAGKAGLPVVVAQDELGITIGTGFIVPTVMYSDTEFGVTEEGTFTITNFHNSAAYTITAINGAVAVDPYGVITYTAPDPEGDGTDEITIALAGHSTTKIPLTILPATVATPSVTTPADSSIDIAYDGLQFSFSAFDPFPAGYYTHSDTRVQVATDAGFTNIVWDSTAGSAVSAMTMTVELARSTVYYVRVQYQATVFGWSPWSATTSFTTAAFIPSFAYFNPSSSLDFRLPSLVATTDKVFASAWNDGDANRLAFASLNTLLSSGTDSKPIFKTCSSLYTGNFWGCATTTDGVSQIFSGGGGVSGSNSRTQAHLASTDDTLGIYSARTWQHNAASTTLYFTDIAYYSGSIYGVGYSYDGGTGVALMVMKINASSFSVEASEFFTTTSLSVGESNTHVAVDSTGVYIVTDVQSEIAVIRCNLATLAEELSINLSGGSFDRPRSILVAGNELIIGTSNTDTLLFALNKTTFAYAQARAFKTNSTDTGQVRSAAYSAARNCVYVTTDNGYFFQISLVDFSLMGQAQTNDVRRIAVGDASDALYSTGDSSSTGDNFDIVSYDGDLTQWPSNGSFGPTYFYTTPTYTKATPPASMSTQAMTLTTESRAVTVDDVYTNVALSNMASGSVSKGEY